MPGSATAVFKSAFEAWRTLSLWRHALALLTLAVLFGSHFLPYGWLYESRAYGFLTVSVAVVLSTAVLVAGSALYAVVPLLTAACYAAAVLMLWSEVRGLPTAPAHSSL